MWKIIALSGLIFSAYTNKVRTWPNLPCDNNGLLSRAASIFKMESFEKHGFMYNYEVDLPFDISSLLKGIPEEIIMNPNPIGKTNRL